MSCKQLTEGRVRVSEAEKPCIQISLCTDIYNISVYNTDTCISYRIFHPERNNFFCSLQVEIRYMNNWFHALDAA